MAIKEGIEGFDTSSSSLPVHTHTHTHKHAHMYKRTQHTNTHVHMHTAHEHATCTQVPKLGVSATLHVHLQRLGHVTLFQPTVSVTYMRYIYAVRCCVLLAHMETPKLGEAQIQDADREKERGTQRDRDTETGTHTTPCVSIVTGPNTLR